MKKIAAICISGIILLVLSIYHAHASELPKRFLFDKQTSLKEWQEKVFKNRVIYTVIPQQKIGFLSAKSEKACSGLFYKIRFNPNELPMIS